MFAHQVIEQMKERPIFLKSDPHYLYDKTFRLKCDKIKDSQKFHMGNTAIFFDIFKTDVNKLLFTEHINELRLPYRLCWFDGYRSSARNNMKIGMLVEEIEKKVWDLSMFYVSSDGGWFLYPTIFHINLNKNETHRILAKNLWPTHLKPEDDRLTDDMGCLQGMIRLLNTKNILMEKNSPSLKLNKKRKKTGRQELFTYKTLKVLVPSDSRSATGNPGSISHQRIHLCRGHFKRYTAKNLLFGKLTGLYWWQPQVRGQNKDGIVLKDYEINVRG